MPAPTQKLPQGPALYLLLFVLADIAALATRGLNPVFLLLTAIAAAGAGAYFWRNLPLLRALPRKV
jgi:hypothetical protein